VPIIRALILLVAAVVIFGLPVLFWKLKTGVTWRFFGTGTVALVVGTVPYVAMMALVFASIYLAGMLAGSGGGFGLGVPEMAFLAVPTFATFILLPSAVLLAFAATRSMRRASWQQAVAFGLGWTVPVSAAGWVRLVYPVDLVTNPMSSGPVAVRTGTVLLMVWGVLGGVLVAALMVYAVRRDGLGWFWASIGLGVASQWGANLIWIGVMRMLGLGLHAEPWTDLVRALAYVPFALFSLWGLWMLRSRWPEVPAEPEAAGRHGVPATPV